MFSIFVLPTAPHTHFDEIYTQKMTHFHKGNASELE
jgi:hypothetical protein